VGGNFAFLALERACGGKAVDSLRFLDGAERNELDVKALLRADKQQLSVAATGDEL
jgi:hypothetical protein